MRLAIAFVHDRLYYKAWAEQVFFDMIDDVLDQWQKTITHYAVFTLFSNDTHLERGGHKIPVITALPRWIFALFVYFDTHKIPLISKILDYRNLMFWYPLLVWILRRKIQAFKPEKTYISSFAVAKNVAPVASKKGDKPLDHHLGVISLHAQSPFMYIHNHYKNNLSKLHFPIKQFYQLAYRYLKPRDSLKRYYDDVTTNSIYTSQLIHTIYGLSSSVIYPKLDHSYATAPMYDTRSDYYVFVGRLIIFSKQVDHIIKACNTLGKKLILIGSGPDEAYLKSIAWPTISFAGWISDKKEKNEIIWKARGLINVTLESFGYVTAESCCLWTPVIWLNAWATPEIVWYDKSVCNGLLIDDQRIPSIQDALIKFEKLSWDYRTIAHQARKRFFEGRE